MEERYETLAFIKETDGGWHTHSVGKVKQTIPLPASRAQVAAAHAAQAAKIASAQQAAVRDRVVMTRSRQMSKDAWEFFKTARPDLITEMLMNKFIYKGRIDFDEISSQMTGFFYVDDDEIYFEHIDDAALMKLKCEK